MKSSAKSATLQSLNSWAGKNVPLDLGMIERFNKHMDFLEKLRYMGIIEESRNSGAP